MREEKWHFEVKLKHICTYQNQINQNVKIICMYALMHEIGPVITCILFIYSIEIEKKPYNVIQV